MRSCVLCTCAYSAAAHIGVGISGLEGQQAVLSSDFSFGQFRYQLVPMYMIYMYIINPQRAYAARIAVIGSVCACVCVCVCVCVHST